MLRLRSRRVLRRAIVPAAIAVVASAGASFALGAYSELRPGTPAHPAGVRMHLTFGWQNLGEDVTTFKVWFPRGAVYNGGHFPSCSAATLDRRGPAGCPRGSIVGSGLGVAYASTTITKPRIVVVNGGANTVYFYTMLNNPARVYEPIIGHLTRLHGDYTYVISSSIPNNLRVVAGVPINLTELDMTVGRGSWIALDGAPAGIKVQTGYINGASQSYQIWVQND